MSWESKKDRKKPRDKRYSRIKATPSKQAPNNSYGPPEYYEDIEFKCKDCGEIEIWTSEQQLVYFEEWKKPIYHKPVRCRECRNKRKEMIKENNIKTKEGLLDKGKDIPEEPSQNIKREIDMPTKQEVRYIELKTGYNDNGPAWIARVSYSKSGKTIYFNGMALKTSKGMGIGGNYFDSKTGDDYWVSGVKSNGWNRHWAGGGKVNIERSLVDWFKKHINYQETGFLVIINDLPKTDIQELHNLENQKLDQDSQ